MRFGLHLSSLTRELEGSLGCRRGLPPSARRRAIPHAEQLERRSYLSAVSFQTPVHYDTGMHNNTVYASPIGFEIAAGSIAVGDFNLDGNVDVVVTNRLDNSVSVLLNRGNGTFAPALNYSIIKPMAVAVADFNHDGVLDLAITSEAPSFGPPMGIVGIAFGNGDGTFVNPAVRYLVGDLPVAVAAGNLRSTGPDVVVASFGDNSGTFFGDNNIFVLVNQGDGTFTYGDSYPFSSKPSAVTIVSNPVEEAADILVAGRAGDQGSLKVMLGDLNTDGVGNGHFHPGGSYAVGPDPASIALGDFNGDRNTDVAVAATGQAAGVSGNVSVLLGNGDPGDTFGPASNNIAGNHPQSVAAGDFNGDGKDDLAVSDGVGAVRVRTGNGNGTFQPAISFPIGFSTGPLVAADFNHDGKTDIAVLDATGVSVLLDSPGASVAGRHVFYNHSRFDGNDSTNNAADDPAVATDKRALLPGQTATFANYTSYSKGINGVIIDVTGLPPGTPAAKDFIFKVGNDSTPSAWPVTTAVPTINVRRAGGAGGSDRLDITFPDGAIQKQWLQVTLKADAATGLARDDVFYFGNAVGEAGNHATDAQVTAQDELLARANPHNLIDNPAPLDYAYDYNRDGKVDAVDQLIARTNHTNFETALQFITVPAAAAAAGAYRATGTADALRKPSPSRQKGVSRPTLPHSGHRSGVARRS